MNKEKTLPYSYPRGMVYVLKFDSSIEEPDNYSYFCDVLLAATEQDVVNIYFSTCGGNGDSMVALMNLIAECKAETNGILLSNADSAGSYLFLSCQNHTVGCYSRMLCHQVSYGMGGSHHEVKAYVDHIDKMEKRLVTETYKYFLSEDEIQSLLNGKQIWLDEEEIVSRLERRNAAYAEDRNTILREALDEAHESSKIPEKVLAKMTKSDIINVFVHGTHDLDEDWNVVEIVED